MAKYYFQIEGEVSKLELDTNAIDISFPSFSRSYNRIDTFNNSGRFNGNGKLNSGVIEFTRKFSNNGSGTAWNSIRENILRYFTINRLKKIYFHIENSDSSRTQKVEVRPLDYSGENYNNLKISGINSLSFLMKDNFYENTLSTVQNIVYIPNSSTQNIQNNGMLETPARFEISLTSNSATWIQLELYDNIGIKILGDFPVNSTVEIDNITNLIKIDGIIQTGLIQFGSFFNLNPGINPIKITSDFIGFAILDVILKERYI